MGCVQIDRMPAESRKENQDQLKGNYYKERDRFYLGRPSTRGDISKRPGLDHRNPTVSGPNLELASEGRSSCYGAGEKFSKWMRRSES